METKNVIESPENGPEQTKKGVGIISNQPINYCPMCGNPVLPTQLIPEDTSQRKIVLKCCDVSCWLNV